MPATTKYWPASHPYPDVVHGGERLENLLLSRQQAIAARLKALPIVIEVESPAAPVRNICAVVHGHTTVPDTTILGNAHLIDTGGGRQPGRFALLDLHTFEAAYGPGIRFFHPPRRSL